MSIIPLVYSAPVSFILPYIFLLAWEFNWFEVSFIDAYLYEFIAKRIRRNNDGYYAIRRRVNDSNDNSEDIDDRSKFRELFNEIIEVKKKRTTTKQPLSDI